MKDAEIIEVSQGFRDGMLNGRSSDLMCAAVALPLAGYLQYFHKLKCEVCVTDEVAYRGKYTVNHVWIRLEDGRVLDPTADQFSTEKQQLPAVYLGPPIDWIHREDADGRQ